MAKEKNAVGRPTKYNIRFCERARRLALLGFTDEELAETFNVSRETIHKWKQEHKEFADAIADGKENADAHVADRLYNRALGYSHAEEKIFQSDGKIIRAETTKHYPPDTQAASLWLRNRQPQKWRDKVDHEHSGPGGGPVLTKELSDNEYARRTAFVLQRARREGKAGTQGPDASEDSGSEVGSESGSTD